MSVTNSIEIRFERLAEEFAPPPLKPTPTDPLRQRYVSQPSDIPRAQSAVRKTYPITRVWVTMCVDMDVMRKRGVDELYVREQLARQLAQELMQQMELRKEEDPTMWQTRYSAMLQIVDPKVKGQYIEQMEWPPQ